MSDQATQTPLIELARSVPNNLHSNWASQFTEDGHAIGYSMAPVGRYLHELADKVESLQSENAALRYRAERYETVANLFHDGFVGSGMAGALNADLIHQAMFFMVDIDLGNPFGTAEAQEQKG